MLMMIVGALQAIVIPIIVVGEWRARRGKVRCDGVIAAFEPYEERGRRYYTPVVVFTTPAGEEKRCPLSYGLRAPSVPERTKHRDVYFDASDDARTHVGMKNVERLLVIPPLLLGAGWILYAFLGI